GQAAAEVYLLFFQIIAQIAAESCGILRHHRYFQSRSHRQGPRIFQLFSCYQTPQASLAASIGSLQADFLSLIYFQAQRLTDWLAVIADGKVLHLHELSGKMVERL